MLPAQAVGSANLQLLAVLVQQPWPKPFDQSWSNPRAPDCSRSAASVAYLDARPGQCPDTRRTAA